MALEGGDGGCGDRVVPVARSVPATRAPLAAALRALRALRGPDGGVPGLYNALHASRLALAGLALRDGVATVRLTGRLTTGGVCDATRVLEQFRRTAPQFPSVRAVRILVNGVPLKGLLSERG